jgi:hypothetical protein
VVKKPPKPYAGFPLFPHSTGRWAKKIRKRFVYFTPWRTPLGEILPDGGGWRAALAEFERQAVDLYAGRECEPLDDSAITGRERMMPRATPMTDALRASIRDCGLTANEIARRTGLHKQTISRFLNGYDLMLSSAELVAEVTGIELRFRPKRMTSTFDMEGGGA